MVVAQQPRWRECRQIRRVRWPDILRLAASMAAGSVVPSHILRKLATYPRRNSLAMALREIGRVERTLFILDWLQSPELRRRATAELNKGEAKDALQCAVCFHRLGRIRDRSVEAQKHPRLPRLSPDVRASRRASVNPSPFYVATPACGGEPPACMAPATLPASALLCELPRAL